MSLMTAMQISSSGMSAQRQRLEIIASNLANSNTTRTAEGGPYRKRDVIFSAAPVGESFSAALDRAVRGVEVSEVVEIQEPPLLRYDPAHPDANQAGYVELPNINPLEETINMISATRSFEANLAVFNSAKDMARSSMEILR